MPNTYAFDPIGNLTANRIVDEQQILTGANHRNQYFLVPRYAPFFAESLSVTHVAADGTQTPLVLNVDYYEAFEFIGASKATEKPIYGGISFLNYSLTGSVKITYQTLGGSWTISEQEIIEILSDTLRNPRVTTWEMVANTPTIFPPIDHEWNLIDMVGVSELRDKLTDIEQAIIDRPATVLAPPQAIPTKNTVGLGNVDNFSTASDVEAEEGNSATLFVTPRGLKQALNYRLTQIQDAIDHILSLAAATGAAIIKTITGQGLDKAGTFVKTIAELRTLDTPALTAAETFLVTCLGIDNYGDSNVSKFYWRATETANDDGIYIIKPDDNNGPGRWVNVQKDAWETEVHPIDDFNKYVLVMDNTPVYSKPIRIVVNKIVELVYKVDFEVSGRAIYFYPNAVESGDIVDINIQVKEIDSNSDKLNIYQKWTVAANQTTFILEKPVIQPKGCRIILNDITNLISPIDFYVNNATNTLVVNFPIEEGDTIELKSINSLPEFGMLQTRELLDPAYGEVAYMDMDNFTLKPLTEVNPINNGEMVFQLNNDTTLLVKVKGSDGIVRGAVLPLTILN